MNSSTTIQSFVIATCLLAAFSPVVHADPSAIDQTGWEKILVDPTSGKPLPAFEGFYTGYGVMAVFGKDARILALYAEDADHTNTDLERRGSKLIAEGARDQYTGMRKGPAIAASLLGKGRVVVVALPPWFDTLATLNQPKKKRTAKKDKIPTAKDGTPLYEQISGTDQVFLRNALHWLTRGKDLSELQIVTCEDNLAAGFGHGSTKLLSDDNFETALKDADVFVGRVDSLTPVQVDSLIAFAERGGGLLTGGGPDKAADSDKRAWYAYPINDQLALRASTRKINHLLHKAGLGIAYGIIDGKTSRQRFDANIPVQWAREYDEMFDAIDELHQVRKDRDNRNVKYRTSPDYQPAEGQDPAIAVATTIGQQIFAMTQVLPEGDPRRAKLDEKLKFLLQPEGEQPAVRGPIQKGLCMHENVSLCRLPPEQTRKSKIADRFLGYPVTSRHARTDKEQLELSLRRDGVQMTEFYAPPGEVVTLDFTYAREVGRKGFQVHINVENSYNFHSELNFLRPPLMQTSFPIDQPIVKISHPYGGIIYIRYQTTGSDGSAGAQNSKPGSIPFIAQQTAEAERILGSNREHPNLFASVTGAVRYPCFVSGKNDNADWQRQLKDYPGYKVGVICRNVWVDIGRRHVEQFGLRDVETWALQFDTSYGRATEVGPSVKSRTTRLTDLCIPGREPGMPTRMGRMSSLDKATASIASVDTETGMTAHKVGHGLFGVKYAWARAIGTGVEFRANQMVWYEEYKKGAKSGRGTGVSTIGLGKDAIHYDANDPYELIGAMGTFLSNPKNSYFSVQINDAELHSSTTGKGTPHLPFLRAKWMYDFDGQQGVNVWAQMNKDFADDILAENDGDPKTQPRFPLRKGNAHVHAEDHAVRWAHLCGYNIVPYFEVFGFQISDRVKDLKVIKESQAWLPMTSRFFNRPEQIGKNASATFDFNRTDEKRMSIALSADRRAIMPDFLGITDTSEFGKLNEESSGVFQYAPNKDFVGRDSFAYKVRHPDTGQEQVFKVYIQVIAPTDIVEPSEALELFGHGALVELFQQPAGSPERKKKRRGKSKSDLLRKPSTLPADLIPSSIYFSVQGFETKAGSEGTARMRAYLEVPEDGDYVFWVASKVGAVLRMNAAGSDPSGAKLLLETTGGKTAKRGSTLTANEQASIVFYGLNGKPNQTQPVSLRKGHRYYVELSQNARDGGKLALGWSRNSSTNGPDEIIPNRFLIPVGRPLSYIPVDDTVKAKTGKSLIIDVLANDLDYRFQDIQNNECLQVSFVGQVANGKTEIIGDRQIRYTPNAGFKGTDKFQYAIQAKSLRDRMRVGSVTVNVSDN